jgi:Sec-independent protein translocase protein TatA
MWNGRLLEFGKWTGLGAVAGFAGGVLFGVINSIAIPSLAINWATVFSFTSWMIFAGVAAVGVLFGAYKAATIKPSGVHSINAAEKGKNKNTSLKQTEVKSSEKEHRKENTIEAHNNDPPEHSLLSNQENIIQTLFKKDDENINNQNAKQERDKNEIQLF